MRHCVLWRRLGVCMTDLMDVLDASGIRTGEVLPRAEVHRLGRFHRAVHLYLLNAEGELLLQRRSQTASEPGVLSVSVTGHVEAGESSAACVQREVEEELGIFAGSLDTRLLFSFFQEGVLEGGRLDRQFIDVYSARTDIDPSSLRLDPAEVSEVLLVPFAEFRRMALEGSGGLAPVYARESGDAEYFLEGMGWVVAQVPAP